MHSLMSATSLVRSQRLAARLDPNVMFVICSLDRLWLSSYKMEDFVGLVGAAMVPSTLLET